MTIFNHRVLKREEIYIYIYEFISIAELVTDFKKINLYPIFINKLTEMYNLFCDAFKLEGW